jgi:hypothetical protein
VKKFLLRIAQLLVILQIPYLVISVLVIRIIRSISKEKRRVVFGGCGIINLSYWSRALQANGLDSKTIVWRTPSIYPEETFDYDLYRHWGNFGYVMAPFHFVRLIAKNEIIVCGFDGFVLGMTLLKKIEPYLLTVAKCKIVAVPYGGDAYVYSQIKNESLSYAIQVSYPFDSQGQLETAKNIERTLKHADFAMSGIMGFDGIGRWDVLAVNPIVIDTSLWSPSTKKLDSEKIRVLHTPNHRGFKGTEFLINAVDELNHEGVEIELVLVEGMPNSTVRSLLSENIDVLVEQLIAPGYAMSAIEGLASGVVVVANLSDERISIPFKRWSYLSECPIVSANPETIKAVLRKLSSDKMMRQEYGALSREYALKYHSYDTFFELYKEIEKYIFGERENMHNFYHPLLGEFRTESKKIAVPPWNLG